MFEFIYLWADIIWIPIVFFLVHKKHRWISVAFVISCMILIRLIAEVMVFIGYEKGIMGFVDMNVHMRGLIISSAFYVLFLLMAHFSSQTDRIVFMAACLSIFFMIFFVASLSMLL